MDTERAETPIEFLTKLGDRLKVQQDVDRDLADLVAQHLLTNAPNEECVNHAFAAMTRLAVDRAALPREQPDE